MLASVISTLVVLIELNIEHFKNVERSRLSVTSKMIARYLLDSVHCHNPRTLSRRFTAIRQRHKLKGLPDPTDSPLVTKTMREIARLHGKPKRQALALRLKNLDRMTQYLKEHEFAISIDSLGLPSLRTLRTKMGASIF